MGGRVVIGMSGGVDSSVAAAVLKEQGYEVIGVTMRLWDGEEVAGTFSESACCSLSAVEDARRVAYQLGIDFRVMDFRKEFEGAVIDYFVSEYQAGRTPNPCIACNQYLKFDAMMKKTELLGAEWIATGHYAKVEYDEDRERYLLKRAGADTKDQTYALYQLNQKQLSKTLFPLGAFASKDEVRRMADRLNLPTAKKPDSQEICFIPDQDYAGFIQRRLGVSPVKGNFVDLKGRIIGEHQGITRYTIGQRKGLGIAFGKPMFVVKIDPEKNEVVLGEQGSEFSMGLLANQLNFIPFDTLDGELSVAAKVRYSARPASAVIQSAGDGKVRVTFEEPQRAITPGQAVVFYEENSDIVIGGGTILQSV